MFFYYQEAPNKIPQEPDVVSTPKKTSVSFKLGQDESKDSPLNSHRSLQIEAESSSSSEQQTSTKSSDSSSQSTKNQTEAKKLILPDVVSTSQVGNLDQQQKIALLTALGINPEYLLSSGAFDKSTFMALLGPNQGIIQ